jgi:hypothetical protein
MKDIQRALMAEDFKSLFYCTSHYVVGIYLWQLIPFYSLRPAFQNGLSGDMNMVRILKENNIIVLTKSLL